MNELSEIDILKVKYTTKTREKNKVIRELKKDIEILNELVLDKEILKAQHNARIRDKNQIIKELQKTNEELRRKSDEKNRELRGEIAEINMKFRSFKSEIKWESNLRTELREFTKGLFLISKFFQTDLNRMDEILETLGFSD